MELDTIVCADALAFLRGLDDGSVDLTVTSPPYDNLRDYNGYSWDFNAIAHELYRVTKVGGVVVWVVGDSVIDFSESLVSMRHALHFVDTVGFNMHDTMIYFRNAMMHPDATRYSSSFEYMFVLSKGRPITTNLLRERLNKYGGRRINAKERQRDGTLMISSGTNLGKVRKEIGVYPNVWLLDVGYMKTTKDKQAYQHPAIFPEELARRHIHTWSNPDDVVLDIFMGSGTTAKVARQLGRHYIGCDISEEYVALAQKRLQDTNAYQDTQVDAHTTQLSLFNGHE